MFLPFRVDTNSNTDCRHRFLPLRVDLNFNRSFRPLHSVPITGTFNATTDRSVPGSVLRYSEPRFSSLGRLPLHHIFRVPAVPQKRLNQSHATFTPVTVHPVSRYLMDLSRKKKWPPVLMTSLYFRRLNDGSLVFVSLILT